MNSIGMNMLPGTSTSTVKPELNATDIQFSAPLATQQKKFPKWIIDFNMKCLEICGTTCSEKLDEMMELYIKEVRREMVNYGPDNASFVVNRMSRTMLFFYLKYVDIKEFIVISQWNEHMEDLLSLYCQLELRSAQRGKDSDIIICSRMMYALRTYLNNDEKYMLHVLLKIPNLSKRHKNILDPIFRKLLVNKKKPECDLEYIRKLFAYKLWKRLYNVDGKKVISELALNELQPPKLFVSNYPKYTFLPRNLGTSDVHRALITSMYDIDNAIKAYFEYVNNRNKKIFDNDYVLPEKKSFMAEFWNSFYTSDNCDEISTNSDTFTLERIKQEVDNIDADDDCIIIEPVESPSSSGNQLRVVVIDSVEVIDLTADENESIAELPGDEVPQWCSNLVKLSEECAPATPPHSIPEEDTPEEVHCVEKEISKSDIEQVTTATQIEKQITSEEIEAKTIEAPPLEVKISNVRRARLDSDSTDLSLPDTLSSSTSEDNSHGFREITSTSHPVQEAPAKNACPSPEHTAVNVNYEQVDSTSNLNENEEMDMNMDMDMDMEMEAPEPTIQAFILERTVSGLVCSDTLSQVPVSATVSNVDFEQFACDQTQGRAPIEPVRGSFTAEGSVSDLNIVSVKHVSEDSAADKNDAFGISYVSSVMERVAQTEVDHFDDDEDEEVDVCSEDNVQSKESEDDIQSPDFEPITQSEHINYVKSLGTSQYYENFYNESLSKVETTSLENRKRKNCDIPQIVRETMKRASKPYSIQEQEQESEREQEQQQVHVQVQAQLQPQQLPQPLPPPLPPPPPPQQQQHDEIIPEVTLNVQTPEYKERRVPVSGEKVCRFEGLWEPVFTDKFRMSKLEYELFNPSVVLKKLNPQHFIPNYNEYAGMSHECPTPCYSQTIDHLHRNNLHLSRFRTKGILEYQQYTKASSFGEKPRARIIQINRSESSASPVHKELSSTITNLKKKKGTGSPDLNINFTLPNLESLSLNSSFQHHFCTDISVCTSATTCFSDTSMSAMISNMDPNLPQHDPRSACRLESDALKLGKMYKLRNAESEPHMQVQIGFKRPACDSNFEKAQIEICPVASTSTSEMVEPKQKAIPAPILPAEVPYWHEIDSSEPLQKFDHSQACPNLLVNINLDQSEQEIHLPIKKRRVSSFKVEIKDELSYPATPMISIAELENIERNKARNHRPFKTPAELKEVPPIQPSYMYNTSIIPPMTTVTDIYNISHTYSTTPTINYHHVTNEPAIIGTPHYQLPSLQPIILPVSRVPKTNWEQPTHSNNNYRKRRQGTSRKETVTNRTVQKSKSHKTKIS